MVVEKKSVLIPFIFQVTRKMQAYKLMGYTGNLTEYVQLTLSIIHSSNRATWHHLLGITLHGACM